MAGPHPQYFRMNLSGVGVFWTLHDSNAEPGLVKDTWGSEFPQMLGRITFAGLVITFPKDLSGLQPFFEDSRDPVPWFGWRREEKESLIVSHCIMMHKAKFQLNFSKSLNPWLKDVSLAVPSIVCICQEGTPPTFPAQTSAETPTGLLLGIYSDREPLPHLCRACPP